MAAGQDIRALLGGAFEQALLEALVFKTKSFVGCIDRQRRILFLNRTYTRPMDEVVGRVMDDFLAPESHADLKRLVEDAFQTQEPRGHEYQVVLENGGKRHLTWQITPFCDAAGNQAALLVAEDDTERHALFEELQKSLEFRRLVAENLPGFVVLLDRHYRFVWVNHLAPGLKLDDVVGTSLERFISPPTVPAMRAAVDAAFESGTTGQYEAEGYGDGQSKAWYLTRVAPVYGEDGKVENALLLTADVTELKRAEHALRETQEQLHRAQRMESIGQLAGGIAHDFNNLLQVITGNLGFARRELSAGRPAHAELEQALRATDRAAELTSHLLAIGRRQRVASKCVELKELVSNSIRMLQRTIPENIRLTFEAPAESCYVELDAPQFEQVLINLCVNARDAMPQGGTLTVRVEPTSSSNVMLQVIDSGVGIPTESLTRVFEPFFTTKGAGSGLGLAVAAGIVAAHGGSIRADSDGAQGTTMTVLLPRSEPNPVERPLSSKPESGGTGLILVAEDAEMVRSQVVRTLEEAGYTVLQAENGAVAVELFQARSHEVNLVVLDVIMPVMDGWQAFLRMRALQPNLRALFTTGYAADVLPADFATHQARLLTKPFTPNQLLAQVHELLEQEGVSHP
ncbi:MAG TPA: PAS domain-containing protein [Polyangiaceae bacterium]|nr:PAS domain-containing protein [Polyangiaceae bacterium]